MDNVTEMLDQLSELRAAVDNLRLKKQELIDAAMPAEVKQALADIDTECQPMIEHLETQAVDLEGRITNLVLIAGESVRGAHLMAVYTKPRVTWDSAKLSGMAALIPGLEAARKVGSPSVSFRRS